jgi:hypothetical protein
VEIESGPRHCMGCGGERCFGDGVACEEFFLESAPNGQRFNGFL